MIRHVESRITLDLNVLRDDANRCDVVESTLEDLSSAWRVSAANRAFQNAEILANFLRIDDYRECFKKSIDEERRDVIKGMREDIWATQLRPRLGRGQVRHNVMGYSI